MVPLIVANVYYRKHLFHNDISPHFQIIIIQWNVFFFYKRSNDDHIYQGCWYFMAVTVYTAYMV